MNIKLAFGAALKKVREYKSMTQEDFSDISSRTYMSTLERGLKSPTIEKVELIAKKLGVHPLTLYTMMYLGTARKDKINKILESVNEDLRKINMS